MKLVCFHCNKENEISDGSKISYREECLHCKSDLHVCKNCHFYDSKVYNECKEPSADVVKEKERANFCDFYQPSNKSAAVDEKAKLKAAAEALFKKN